MLIALLLTVVVARMVHALMAYAAAANAGTDASYFSLLTRGVSVERYATHYIWLARLQRDDAGNITDITIERHIGTDEEGRWLREWEDYGGLASMVCWGGVELTGPFQWRQGWEAASHIQEAAEGPAMAEKLKSIQMAMLEEVPRSELDASIHFARKTSDSGIELTEGRRNESLVAFGVAVCAVSFGAVYFATGRIHRRRVATASAS